MLSEQFLIEVKLKEEKIEDKTAFPFSLNALQAFSNLRLHPKVTFLVGENGSGKSTLINHFLYSTIHFSHQVINFKILSSLIKIIFNIHSVFFNIKTYY